MSTKYYEAKYKKNICVHFQQHDVIFEIIDIIQ